MAPHRAPVAATPGPNACARMGRLVWPKYARVIERPSTAPFPRPGVQPVVCRASELIALSGFVWDGTEAAGRPWHKQGISTRTAHVICRGHVHEEGSRWDPPMPLQRHYKCPPRALIRRGLVFPGPGSAREVQAAGLELHFHVRHTRYARAHLRPSLTSQRYRGLVWPPLEHSTEPYYRAAPQAQFGGAPKARPHRSGMGLDRGHVSPAQWTILPRPSGRWLLDIWPARPHHWPHTRSHRASLTLPRPPTRSRDPKNSTTGQSPLDVW